MRQTRHTILDRKAKSQRERTGMHIRHYLQVTKIARTAAINKTDKREGRN